MKLATAKIALFAILGVFSLASNAATLRVTTSLDGPLAAAATQDCFPFQTGSPIDALFCSDVPSANVAGCTLREAMATAEGLYTGSDCPAETGSGAVTAASADLIIVDAAARGTIQLQASLPVIKNPVTIRGLGPDQTVITGDALSLASSFRPDDFPKATFGPRPTTITTRFAELPIFQVHPDLADGQEVRIENLTVRGARIHAYRSVGVREVVDTSLGPLFTSSNCVGPTDSNPSPRLPACCGPQPSNSPNADVGDNYQACSALEADKNVINFAGIVMDSGLANVRKKLTLKDTRSVCNRRGTPPTSTSVQNSTVIPSTPTTVSFVDDGGAVSVEGFVTLTLDTASFSHNVSENGSGGAVYAGAKDNASPEVIATGTRFDADGGQQCQDAVFAFYANEDTDLADALDAANSCTASSSSDLRSPCPTTAHVTAQGTNVYLSYQPGNFAGAATTPGAAAISDLVRRSAAFPPVLAADAAALPLSNSRLPNGGALAINALNATLARIGPLTLTNSRFFGSSARRDGGALSIVNVARQSGAGDAFTLNEVLFSSSSNTSNGVLLTQGSAANAINNRAAGNGGAISIIGNANQAASTKFSIVSMSFNRANQDGGAMHYQASPFAPIDFNMTNIRVGSNTAGRFGGGIFAADNGVDDSGLLNISKATFDNNTAGVAVNNGRLVSAAGGGGGAGIFCGATKLGSQFTNVTLSANVAPVGGGLFIGDRCHVSVNNATIFGNSSVLRGTIDNSGTKNGGGGIFVAPTSNNGNVVLRNSILAYNLSVDRQVNELNQPTRDADASIQALNGPDCSAPNRDVLRTAGFNFVGTNTGCGPIGQDDVQQPFRSGVTTVAGVSRCLNADTGDMVGNRARTDACDSDPNPLNPQLRVLSDNGAPSGSPSNNILGARNFTHLPETGSPVINSASTAGCVDGLGSSIVDDERGFLRGGTAGRCDIGAVELNGGLTPQVATLAVESVAGAVATSVQLPNFSQAVELLRLRITGPSDQVVRIKTITVRKEDVESGAFGDYASAMGYEVVAVNEQGQQVLTNKLFESSSSPVFASGTGQLPITFTSPLELQPGQVRFISVRLVFDASLRRVAKAESPLMLATATGGLGMLALLGLTAFGPARRRTLMLAMVLLATAGFSGCSGDDGDSFNDGERTFRISARQLTFDTDAQANNPQSFTALGPTVKVKNP